MRCVDVNVLVDAHRADLAEHERYGPVLEELADDRGPLPLLGVVLSGFVRVMTKRRVFAAPTSPSVAWAAVDALLAAPAARVVKPGRRHWNHFRALAAAIDGRGNDITDAYLAAHALENNAVWLSADRGLARFPSFRWQHPLGR